MIRPLGCEAKRGGMSHECHNRVPVYHDIKPRQHHQFSTVRDQCRVGIGGGSLSGGGREKPALRKGDSELTPGGTPSAGKSKQIPALPDRTQVLEERLRSGLMEKPIAQGEVSDRLNQLYGGSNSPFRREPEVHDEPA